MVGAGNAFGGDDLARERPKPPLHAIADHGAADLLRDGKTHSHRHIRILPIADEQNKAGSGRAQAAVRGNEIGALADRD
jgi:hypothetical protein